MAKLSPIEALGVARLRASRAQPYVQSALYRLRPVEAKGLKTVGVDVGWRLYYDPDTIVEWTPVELAGALLHEVWHLLRHHAARLGAKDPQAWNIAGDLEINDDLPRPGSQLDAHYAILPGEGLWPGKDGDAFLKSLPEGLTAEEYYAKLPRHGGKGGCDGNGPGGTCSKHGPKGNGKIASGTCGGAAGNPTEAEKKAQADAQARGDLPAAITPAEAHVVGTQVAQAVKAHERAKGRGSLPAGIAVWADEALGPEKIHWRRALRGAVRRALAEVSGMSDYTYRYPSRRQVPGVILPALRGPAPDVALVMDWSGSMFSAGTDAKTIAGDALREVRGVLKAVGAKGVRYIACDSAAGKAARVFNMKDVKRYSTGGGGTDMGAGLAAAAALDPRPNITVVLTDGDTGWPAEKPNCGKVIVGILPGGGGSDAPAWAKTVRIEEDAA